METGAKSTTLETPVLPNEKQDATKKRNCRSDLDPEPTFQKEREKMKRRLTSWNWISSVAPEMVLGIFALTLLIFGTYTKKLL